MKSNNWIKSTGEYLCTMDEFGLHILGFVKYFVIKEHRERWAYILKKKNSQVYSKSNTLSNYLEKKRCILFKSYEDILNSPRLKTKTYNGIYYDFISEPYWTKLEDVVNNDIERTAIFSIEPEMLVVFFHHEVFAWLCTR